MYSASKRLSITRYASNHGVARAARHFSSVLSHPVNESTVRSMQKKYLQKIKQHTIRNYILKLREAGGVVIVPIVIAVACVIIAHERKDMLSEFGGSFIPTKNWARCMLDRMGFTKPKGTKVAKKKSDDLHEIQQNFVLKFLDVVSKHQIPADMVVNWDQTGVRMVSSGNWTMEKKGSCQVAIAGLDDKREITVLLAVNMLGETLPSQVLYQGTTDRCHARYDCPDSWNITHTASHWSTESTILEYLEKVVDPYFVLKRQELGLPEKHHGLLIVDVFKAHRTDAVRKFLDARYISVLYVPVSYTGNLQPLDLTVNKSFKED